MTNEYIRKIALEQAAYDSACAPEDFLRDEPVVVISKENPRARRYLKLPYFLDLTSYGSNVVASCSPEIADFAREFLAEREPCRCFETPELYELNAELAKYGQRIRHMAEYFLPDVDALAEAERRNSCPFPTKLLERGDFAGLYKPEWSNALCEARPELDELGVGAVDGERMVGFAACSADGEEMRQIGIDVLPDYRGRGIAKSLVTRLALEIIERGKVPFYCAAWSNVRSVKCALASGFKPGWVVVTSKPMNM